MGHCCSAVILAGGLNSRFAGKNKALLTVNGISILDRIYGQLARSFEEIILVSNEPTTYLHWDLTIVADVFSARSPLTGIHAGLLAIASPNAFVVACDTPFVRRSLVEQLIADIDPRVDVLVPQTADGLQPLFAVYNKRCLPVIGTLLAQQTPRNIDGRRLQPGLKVQRLFDDLRVVRVPEAALREADPELISFFNINCPEDLMEAERRLSLRQLR